jgi:hypothetical protein
MRRRSFLKLIGLVTVWASSIGANAVSAASRISTRGPAPTAGRIPTGGAAGLSSSGLRYRADGARVFVSSNDGTSWARHTYLGPDLTIRRLVTDASGVHLTVGYRGRTFGLTLGSDQRSWLTV